MGQIVVPYSSSFHCVHAAGDSDAEAGRDADDKFSLDLPGNIKVKSQPGKDGIFGRV